MALGHFKHGEHSDTARRFGFPPAGKLQHPPLCEGLHRGGSSSQDPVAVCWQSHQSKSRVSGFLADVLACS